MTMEDTLTTTLEPMQKIQLILLAGNSALEFNFTPSPVEFGFLYGIGSQGLEPFERTLAELSPGESMTISVTADEAPEFFGHLLGPMRQVLGLHLLPANLFLKLTLASISKADNREVVQALARAAGHGGCGGSCDCGCGAK